MQVDFGELENMGVYRFEGRDYAIWVNTSLPEVRRKQIEREMLTGTLKVKGHVYIPEKRGRGENTQRAIDFLAGIGGFEQRVMDMPETR